MTKPAVPDSSARRFRFPLAGSTPIPWSEDVEDWTDGDLQETVDRAVRSRVPSGVPLADYLARPTSFLTLDADVSGFLRNLRQRATVVPLGLCYTLKVANHLQANDLEFDLATLVFLGRLNATARMMAEEFDRPVRMALAVEDELFNSIVFSYPAELQARRRNALQELTRLKERLGFSLVDLVPLGDLVTPQFAQTFADVVSGNAPYRHPELDAKARSTMRITFRLAYPTDDYLGAVSTYRSKTERRVIEAWARSTIGRYEAFFAARDADRFWDRLGSRYVRMTDSDRPGVLHVDFAMGRASIPHGVCVVSPRSLSVEYFHDVVAGALRRGQVVRPIRAVGRIIAYRLVSLGAGG